MEGRFRRGISMASAISEEDFLSDICQASDSFTKNEPHVHIRQTESSYYMNIPSLL
jgi:hypothetical protein